MTKPTKKTVITIIIVAVIVICLCVTIAVLFPMYQKHNAEYQRLYNQSKIRIVVKGESMGEYTLSELLELCEAEQFEAVFKPNLTVPKKKTYTGIELKSLLFAMNVDLEQCEGVQFNSSDGMQKIYTKQQLLKDNNVFITYLVDGEAFNVNSSKPYDDPRENGGPFVIIKAEDPVSQNRAKWLSEIVLL